MKILMEHPNLGPERRQTVDGEQFRLAWEPAGWVEIERIHETGDTEFEAALPATPPPPSWELHEEDEEGESTKASTSKSSKKDTSEA
jgi:hypothetical protein